MTNNQIKNLLTNFLDSGELFSVIVSKGIEDDINCHTHSLTVNHYEFMESWKSNGIILKGLSKEGVCAEIMFPLKNMFCIRQSDHLLALMYPELLVQIRHINP